MEKKIRTINSIQKWNFCSNFAFEFKVFLIFTVQILINCFGRFVAATQNEPFDTVIAHSN